MIPDPESNHGRYCILVLALVDKGRSAGQARSPSGRMETSGQARRSRGAAALVPPTACQPIPPHGPYVVE